MTFVRTLTGFTPPKRYDAVPFNQALIQEAATATGSWSTIETKAITPVDGDPSNPASRNFTTALAVLDPGWYRINWKDAGGATFESDAVQSGTGTSSSLCTLADVRALMQKKTTDIAQDPLITDLIADASVAVMGWCEREFAPASSAVTRTFEWPWEGQWVSLAPYDARAVTSVVVDSDQGAGITISTDEWRLWPQPARDGTFMAIRLRPFGAALGRVVWANRQVKITGDWGFATVPADVARATAMTVVHWMTVNTAAFRVPDDGVNGALPPRRGIPPEAMMLLSRYKRAVTW